MKGKTLKSVSFLDMNGFYQTFFTIFRISRIVSNNDIFAINKLVLLFTNHFYKGNTLS